MAIYDCFTFYNEIDCLRVRLSLLAPIVDKFVIVEMSRTQRGAEKPFYFDGFKELLEPWKDKIISLQVQDCPEYIDDGTSTNFTLENFQRNCIMRALTHCRPEDLVIIGDVDEIPSPQVLKNIANVRPRAFLKGLYPFLKTFFWYLYLADGKNITRYHKMSAAELLDYTPLCFGQELCYYHLNNACTNFEWPGTVIAKYKNMFMPQRLRDYRSIIPRIKNGGWHFSFLGGAERVRTKLKTNCEVLEMIERKDIKRLIKKCGSVEQYVDWCVEEGRDVWNQWKFKYKSESKIDDLLKPLKKDFPQLFKFTGAGE